jgi:hypothetical protein
MALQLELDEATNDENRVNEIYKKKYESDMLERIFWYEVRQAYSTWMGGVGIRKDFVLVKTKDDNTFMDYLKRHFGG